MSVINTKKLNLQILRPLYIEIDRDLRHERLLQKKKFIGQFSTWWSITLHEEWGPLWKYVSFWPLRQYLRKEEMKKWNCAQLWHSISQVFSRYKVHRKVTLTGTISKKGLNNQRFFRGVYRQKEGNSSQTLFYEFFSLKQPMNYDSYRSRMAWISIGRRFRKLTHKIENEFLEIQAEHFQFIHINLVCCKINVRNKIFYLLFASSEFTSSPHLHPHFTIIWESSRFGPCKCSKASCTFDKS